MRNRTGRILSSALLLAALAGCAASSGPRGTVAPQATGDNPDRYNFTVSLDGISSALGNESLEDRARKIIEHYRQDHGYNSYEVVSRKPVGGSENTLQYEVQFAR